MQPNGERPPPPPLRAVHIFNMVREHFGFVDELNSIDLAYLSFLNEWLAAQRKLAATMLPSSAALRSRLVTKCTCVLCARERIVMSRHRSFNGAAAASPPVSPPVSPRASCRPSQPQPPPLRIAFTGRSQSGKREAADHLARRHGGRVLTFSEPVYAVLHRVQRMLSMQRCADALFLDMCVDYASRVEPGVWVRLLLAALDMHWRENIFVADLSTRREHAALLGAGFYVVRIKRSEGANGEGPRTVAKPLASSEEATDENRRLILGALSNKRARRSGTETRDDSPSLDDTPGIVSIYNCQEVEELHSVAEAVAEYAMARSCERAK